MNQEPSKWKRISREVVFDHSRMHLVEDTVELPDGTTAEYLLQAPAQVHSVGIIALNDLHQILLQREYSYPTNEILWQLPGGGMKPGETVEAAASRELREESGYTPEKCEIIGSFYTNNRRSDERQFVVLCNGLLKSNMEADPEEFIFSNWVGISELTDMIGRGEIENVTLLAAVSLMRSRDTAF